MHIDRSTGRRRRTAAPLQVVLMHKVSPVFSRLMVCRWVSSHAATPTSSRLTSCLLSSRTQTQGAAGWSLPGHSLLCKHSSAAAVWGSRPLPVQPRRWKPAAVRAAGEQLNAVRTPDFFLWPGSSLQLLLRFLLLAKVVFYLRRRD